MVNLENAIWDIEHIRKRLGDESVINIRFLISLFNQYRAKSIMQWNDQMRSIQDDWVQKFYNEMPTKVDTGDIGIVSPVVSSTVPYFGKLRFPGTLTGKTGNFGIVRLYTTDGAIRFFETKRDILELMIQVSDPLLDQFKWFIKEGDSIYLWKYINAISAELILDDPFKGYIYRNEYVPSGYIMPDEEYTIVDLAPGTLSIASALRYNNTNLAAGSNFIGIQDITTYQALRANIYVKYANQKKMLTLQDPYPLDSGTIEDIMWTILTKDLQLESQAVRDVVGDSADTLNLLKQDKS